MVRGVVSVGGAIILFFVCLYGGWILFAVGLRFGKWFKRRVHDKVIGK